MIAMPAGALIAGRRKMCGSMIGSPDEIREMLELAAKKNVQPFFEERSMKDANQTLIDMDQGKARFRYVLVNEEHL
jgi:alcohol dehydrogenase (NADP+)